jgi:hypothetical protein
VRGTPSDLDELALRPSFGIVQAITQFDDEAGTRSTSKDNGFELSLGVDLFSKHWTAEGVFRNFSQRMRETDINLIYRGEASWQNFYKLGGGLSTRSIKGLSQSDFPAAQFILGAESYLHPQFYFGFQLSARFFMVPSHSDKFTLESGLQLGTRF